MGRYSFKSYIIEWIISPRLLISFKPIKFGSFEFEEDEFFSRRTLLLSTKFLIKHVLSFPVLFLVPKSSNCISLYVLSASLWLDCQISVLTFCICYYSSHRSSWSSPSMHCYPFQSWLIGYNASTIFNIKLTFNNGE